LYAGFSFLFLFFLRLGAKIIFDYFSQNGGKITPVMIYGTKTAAVGIAKMLNSGQADIKYKLVGFIDDDKKSTQRMIMGVKVYHFDEKTIKKTISKKAKAIIISPTQMKKINPEVDLELFLSNHLQVLTAPPVSIWKNDMPTIKQIKSIQIEDLLERPKIHIDTEKISAEHKGKVILVTGAAGSIGSEIVNQIISYQPQLIVLLDQAESPMHNLRLELEEKFPDQNMSVFLADVRNKDRMEYMMDMYRPDYVYHAAAYKHVPLMEDNPVESIQVNVRGTKIIADLAVKYKVQRFVMVSTDKAVNPTNVMGASKRIAEIYVQSLYKKLIENGNHTTKFITTRFGNVLGSNGSVIPLFKSQIEKGGPVTVTHPEIIRYFMTIPEACTLVLEAGVMGNGGEIFIFDMGQPVKIVNLAKKMIRLAGYIPEVDIKIEFTGLRPGEKLYEELLNQKEITTKTHHPKIMIAKVQEYDFDQISAQIDELINYSLLCKNFLTVSQMKKIVPEFKSKNSQYERLDV
jgi:FlaA1/EpsC-like NDP-sugar epimerase